MTDAAGKARFTTVLPGCYVGRWPHIHFEVFTGLHAAVSGDNSLVISQFVVPGAVANAVYSGDPRYAGSIGNLANVALGADFVFSDNTPEQITAQTLVMTGSANAGYQASATVGIASAGLLRRVRDITHLTFGSPDWIEPSRAKAVCL